MADQDIRVVARTVPWWSFLVTGIAWTIIAWIVLRFNYTSVRSIATLAGIVILVAGLAEFFNMFAAASWRWLHGILGVLFVITGIVALINPGRTFVWLAAFIGWYLLFKGITDIMLAFATKHENDAWWLSLIVGIFELGIGFWAAGRFARSAYILILYVGVIALTRGITDIVNAFRLRKLEHKPETSIADIEKMGTNPTSTERTSAARNGSAPLGTAGSSR